MREKRMVNPPEISLLQSFFVLPEIKKIVSSRGNAEQRAQVVTQRTLYTKQSKQGISQPVRNMQNTSEACVHSWEERWEVWRVTGSLSWVGHICRWMRRTVTWKRTEGVMKQWNFYSLRHTFISGWALLLTELSTVRTFTVQISAYFFFQSEPKHVN